MREVEGDLFEYDGPAIGHGVNCKGKMGAGIAKEFKRRFPGMFDQYKQHCDTGKLMPGGVYVYRAEDNRAICNLATQDEPGPNADYALLVASLIHTLNELLRIGIREIALPRLGCGIGGLEWRAVRTFLQVVEGIADMEGEKFEFVIYSLPETTEGDQTQ